MHIYCLVRHPGKYSNPSWSSWRSLCACQKKNSADVPHGWRRLSPPHIWNLDLLVFWETSGRILGPPSLLLSLLLEQTFKYPIISIDLVDGSQSEWVDLDFFMARLGVAVCMRSGMHVMQRDPGWWGWHTVQQEKNGPWSLETFRTPSIVVGF